MGPGKYDDLCTLVRKGTGIGLTRGGAVAVLVIGGERGSGFSVQADPEHARLLPDLLEDIARQIRADGIARAKPDKAG